MALEGAARWELQRRIEVGPQAFIEPLYTELPVEDAVSVLEAPGGRECAHPYVMSWGGGRSYRGQGVKDTKILDKNTVAVGVCTSQCSEADRPGANLGFKGTFPEQPQAQSAAT